MNEIAFDICKLKNSDWLAGILGLTRSAIEKRRYQHPELLPPSIKIGRKVYYQEDVVSKWIAQHRV